jgi:tetratricopeptide (TPR) repeat protein
MSDTLQQAIAAIKAGDKAGGQRLLAEVIRNDPRNEAAWLWMSAVVGSDERQRACLERVLAVNPSNQTAQRGLAKLQRDRVGQFKPSQAFSQPVPPLPGIPLKTAGTSSSIAGPVPSAASTAKTARATFPWRGLLVLLGVALFGCGIMGVSAYLMSARSQGAQRQLAPLSTATLPSAVATPGSASPDITRPAGVSRATPTAGAGARSPAPGGPTATPPGEDITDSNYIQGKTAYQAKNYEEVLKRMTLVLEANPRLAPPHWYRGMAYFYTQNYQAMLDEMEQALAIDPDYALGYADRGLAYSSLGDEQRAMADWQKALMLDPTLAKVHHNMGVSYHNHNDYASAVQEYTLALAIDPTRAETWNGRAEDLDNMGQYQECIESASRALELQPDLWPSYYARGSCRANVGQYAPAISDFDVYLRAVPDNPKAWYNRALTYRLSHLGSNQQALADYTRAIELDPTFAWALINRGNVYIDLKEYELALRDYDAALALGEIPRAYVGRGEACSGLKRYDEAEAALKKAIDLLPNYNVAYGTLAEVYLAQSKYSDAIVAANRTLALSTVAGDKAYSLEKRGRAYYGLGDYERAIQDFNQEIALRPVALSYYYRGIAYQAAGQKELAIKDLEFFLAQGGAQDQVKIDDAKAKLSELRQ